MSEPNNNRNLVFINDYVCAGFPNQAADYIENEIDLNDLLISHPASTFFIKVSGDSMIDAEIHDGDVIMIDRSVEPRDGAIVLAVLNGEFTIKRFRRDPIRLEPENKRFRGITVSSTDDFEIWGVVSYVIHKPK